NETVAAIEQVASTEQVATRVEPVAGVDTVDTAVHTDLAAVTESIEKVEAVEAIEAGAVESALVTADAIDEPVVQELVADAQHLALVNNITQGTWFEMQGEAG